MRSLPGREQPRPPHHTARRDRGPGQPRTEELVTHSVNDVESIIRAVADCEPLAENDDDLSGVWFTCGFCDASSWGKRVGPYAYEPGEPIEHPESCPWWRAREWVEANPTR